MTRPEVVGHAGAGGFFPGNSLQAMQKALEIGVDRIECDVQRSADGDLVLVHDEELTDARGRRRPVKRITTAELRERLPGFILLDDLVELTGGRTPLMLDVKGPGYEAELIAGIRRLNLQEASSLCCTWPTTLRRLRHVFPTMRLGLSTGHWARSAPTRALRFAARSTLRATIRFPLIPAMAAAGATEAMLYHRVVTAPLVAAVHASGRKVNVWTVDHPDHIRRLIRLNVDGITSDRPDIVRQIVDEELGVGPSPSARRAEETSRDS